VITYFKNIFCEEFTLKASVSFEVITENILYSASLHTLPAFFLTPRQQLPSNLVKNLFPSSYIKIVKERSIGYDTHPVGTVIQKSLKVPER
jgi:hypothetical protein